MSLAVAIQMDHVASIDIDADSTVMLAMEAQARGHGLFHYEPDALVFRDGKLFARAQPMEVRREKGNHFTLGAEEELDTPLGLLSASPLRLEHSGPNADWPDAWSFHLFGENTWLGQEGVLRYGPRTGPWSEVFDRSP